jgi:hypothetical protein
MGSDRVRDSAAATDMKPTVTSAVLHQVLEAFLASPSACDAYCLFLTMLDKLDIHVDNIGDSTGRVDL